MTNPQRARQRPASRAAEWHDLRHCDATLINQFPELVVNASVSTVVKEDFRFVPSYVLYVYAPSDFVGGLPDEQNAAAAGTAPFTLTLSPTATPTLIYVDDNDDVFDEIDTQTLISDATIGSTTYSAGTTISTSYDLIDSGSGHKVTTLHFGGDGYQQGAVDGLVSTEPLVPGQSYTFDVERTSHNYNNEYDQYVACFTTGTHLRTPGGEKAIEDLEPGDPGLDAG